MKSVLIANRGEIAIRIARSAADLGIRTVAIFPADDARSLHVRRADAAVQLKAHGTRAYLDGEQIIATAVTAGCDAIHPGYGFLSESAAFASACRKAGLIFVGPQTQQLALFGDKTRSRQLAQSLDVPVMRGTFAATTLNEAATFLRGLGDGQMVLKASGGGGGRGMRVVSDATELSSAYARCQSEAKTAFGVSDLYAEEYLPQARHIEIQVIGDGSGNVTHLYERDCTLQRRFQKLVEISPAPGISLQLRDRLIEAALAMAKHVRYSSLGTFEFLVTPDETRFVFIEANARLQVEHTVTEQILGIDLVNAQLRIAGGATLHEISLTQSQIRPPQSMSIQLRVNMETMLEDGSAKPSVGELVVFEPPGGPGVRVDTFGYAGYQTHPGFDSLLAKLIVVSSRGDFRELAARAYRALSEFHVEGVATNIPLLLNLLRNEQFLCNDVTTRFIEQQAPSLVVPGVHAQRFMERVVSDASPVTGITASDDDQSGIALRSQLHGTIASIDVAIGDLVCRGQQVLVMESMKMEHVLEAGISGIVTSINVTTGTAVVEGTALLYIEAATADDLSCVGEAIVDPNFIRPDLQEVVERHARTRDAARPAAVARRRASQQRTARENVDDLCDADSFVEYGPLVLAAQRARRSVEELIDKSPADGMIAGVGRVNGHLFGDPDSRAVVMAYDYTVFAGTQGTRNHLKTDRMIRLAQSSRMPVVLFAEGGGGRPGDTESSGDSGGTPTFGDFAELSGLVPLVGMTSGRCFAGNASLLGCSDIVIATTDSNIGMGGPAMIEGGGLGVFAPEDIGPLSVQLANGVVDIGVRDEREAVQVAKQYLAYFQGRTPACEAADQRVLRDAVPENRLRVYDIRKVIETLSDVGWVLELRREFGRGMLTSLIRIEGRSVGVIANNPQHLGGAIDSDGADKAARFMQLCDAYDIPLLFLCDTPGIMVGPDAEKTALVRHSSRMFVIGANLQVPFFTIVLRKAYGLGALAMAGGSFKRSAFTVAWPTGEFGGMGLEGAVKLAYRNELANIPDARERRAHYDALVRQMYERGKALSISTIFGVDDTIDPASSRAWLATLLSSIRTQPRGAVKRRSHIDTW